MASKCSRMYKQCFIILLLVLLHQTESKPKGGRRTGSSSGSRYNTGTRHSSQQHNTGSNSGHDTYHQSSHTYNTGNSHPVVPSAPVGNPGNTHSIGFEHFNNQHQSSGTNQNSRHDVGFENVQNRVPQQTHQTGYNVNQHNSHGGHRNSSGGGYYGGGTHNTQQHGSYNNNHQTRLNSSSNVPLNSGYPGQGSYPGGNQNYNNQYGGHPHSPYISPNPPGGYYNPNLAQPGAAGAPGGYYHQYHSVPNGPPPQLYQPYPVQQQSSGGSALGYVGSLAGGLAGGYLIGRLTSGGGGGGGSSSSNDNYVVHHYHHNSDEIPKQLTVTNNSLATCAQNATQGLCVPNTFPVCLYNGTIMCVTHTLYTTQCVGLNTTSACVISLLPPCANGDPNCNATNNNSSTAVYVPCISNVTLSNPGSGNVAETSSGANNGQIVGNRVELCVTAIAEPKYVPPPPPPMVNPVWVNQPQIQPAGQPYNKPSKGSQHSLMSGWAFGLIIVLWVGIK